MRRRSSRLSSAARHRARDDVALDALHDVERRADDRGVVAHREHGGHARAAGERRQHARLAQDVVRAGRQRAARRAAQHDVGAVAAQRVGHVGVAVADGRDLDARRRPGRARRGRPSAARGRAAARARWPRPRRGCGRRRPGRPGCSPRETLVLRCRKRRRRARCRRDHNLCGSPGGSWGSAHPHATFLNPHRPGVRRGRAARPGRRAGVQDAVADLRGAARPQGPRDPRPGLQATSPRSACTRCASCSTGTTSRPQPDSRVKPKFAETDPASYDWGALRRRRRRHQGARVEPAADRLGPGPAVGHQRRARHAHAPEPGRVPEVRARRRHSTTARRSTPGASGTSPTSRSSCMPQYSVHHRRRCRRGSTASSSSPPSAAWPTPASPTRRCCWGRPRRAARARSSRR